MLHFQAQKKRKKEKEKIRILPPYAWDHSQLFIGLDPQTGASLFSTPKMHTIVLFVPFHYRVWITCFPTFHSSTPSSTAHVPLSSRACLAILRHEKRGWCHWSKGVGFCRESEKESPRLLRGCCLCSRTAFHRTLVMSIILPAPQRDFCTFALPRLHVDVPLSERSKGIPVTN